MAWNSRKLNAPQAFLYEDVAVTNTTGQYLDPNLIFRWLRDFPFHNFEVSAWFGNLRYFHASHFFLRWIVKDCKPKTRRWKPKALLQMTIRSRRSQKNDAYTQIIPAG